VVFSIGDPDPALATASVKPDVVDEAELARSGALVAPGTDELALSVEVVDPRVAVAVGHVEVALWREGDACRPIERLAPRANVARLSQRPELAAFQGRLDNAVAGHVDEVEVLAVGFSTQSQAVRALRELVAPGAENLPIAAVDDDGRLGALVHVDAV